MLIYWTKTCNEDKKQVLIVASRRSVYKQVLRKMSRKKANKCYQTVKKKILVLGNETKISNLNSRRRQEHSKLGICSTIRIGIAGLPLCYIENKIKI